MTEDKPPLDTLDPDDDDDVSLPQAMWAAANPDHIDPETDPKETAQHSLLTSLHLCGAKMAMLGDDDEALHRHLNKAIQHHTAVHGAVFARAAEPAETNLHSRGGE
jgi:hypothetical protein